MSTKTPQKTILRGTVIPDFTLNDANGSPVASRSYYMRRNMVIALLPASPDDRWFQWANHVAQAAGHVADGDAQFFLIARSADHLGQIKTDRTDVALLADSDGKAAERFGHDANSGMLVITDRFGVVFRIATGEPETEELDPAEIPGWIEFIACRCT